MSGKVRSTIGLIVATVNLLLWIWAAYHIHKLTICNKAMKLWFYHNQGIIIDMDYLYEDGKRWVNKPEYQIPKEK